MIENLLRRTNSKMVSELKIYAIAVRDQPAGLLR
jgi:hypothetical protein